MLKVNCNIGLSEDNLNFKNTVEFAIISGLKNGVVI